VPPIKNANYLNSLLSKINITISDALDEQSLRVENISFSLPFSKECLPAHQGTMIIHL